MVERGYRQGRTRKNTACRIKYCSYSYWTETRVCNTTEQTSRAARSRCGLNVQAPVRAKPRAITDIPIGPDTAERTGRDGDGLRRATQVENGISRFDHVPRWKLCRARSNRTSSAKPETETAGSQVALAGAQQTYIVAVTHPRHVQHGGDFASKFLRRPDHAPLSVCHSV